MDINSWFLGFFEADGYLTYQTTRKKGRVPTMGITQLGPRPGIIATALLGGRRSYVVPRAKRKGYGKRYSPRWAWELRDKWGLLEALWFFDQHQLIGPKKDEYEIWRKMVLRYVENNYRDDILINLCDDLSAEKEAYKNKGE